MLLQLNNIDEQWRRDLSVELGRVLTRVQLLFHQHAQAKDKQLRVVKAELLDWGRLTKLLEEVFGQLVEHDQLDLGQQSRLACLPH